MTQRALNAAVPGQNALRGWGAATAAAAAQQKQLSFLNSTQAITGQSASQLSKSVLQLSRDLPVGDRQVAATVQTVTQLGVALKGQEGQVASLSRTFIQLQSANGGSAPQYATGLTQLERTFGDNGLDPSKIKATGDALTYVSKLSGAGAQSTLDFANAIAPITQNAGIGKAATLGIAAGFSRIGQDGTYAATAVTKVLGDLNNAVRYGGPQLNTYANIVGTTASNFERIYKANPAQALNQVFQAIGNSGQQGPYILQTLGLDGVRTQRAIQAISAQGGLQPQINQALAGYGSGATQKASNANFNNVVDNLQRAGEAGKQVALAFGEPLLRPLGTFASVLAHVTGGIAGLAGGVLSNPVVSGAVGYGGLALLGARFGLRAGTVATLGNQALRSGPVGALTAGLRVGRGDPITRDLSSGAIVGVGKPGVLGSTSGAVLNRYESDGLGAFNSRFLGLGLALGGRGRGGPGDIPGAVGPFSRVRNLGVNSANFFGNLAVASQYSALNPDPTARSAQFRETLANRNPFARYITPAGAAAATAAGGNPELIGLSQSARNASATLGQLGKESAGLGGAFRSVTRYAASTLAAPVTVLRQPGVGSSLAGIGGSVARGIGGALLNPLTLGLGAFAGYQAIQDAQKHTNQQWSDFRDSAAQQSPTQFLDAYNQALGKATDTTQTFSTALASASTTLATTQTVGQVSKVTPQDVSAALQQKKNTVDYVPLGDPSKVAKDSKLLGGNFTGGGTGVQQIASYIRAGSPGGIAPDQLQVIKQDLIRQYGAGQAQQIISSLGLDSSGQYKSGSGFGGQDIKNLITNAAANQDKGFGGNTGKNAGLSPNAPNKNTKADLSQIFQGISQQYGTNAANLGTPYATQQEFQQVNSGAGTAAASKNADVFQAYVTQAWISLGGDPKKVPKITYGDLAKNNGDLVKTFSDKSPDFKSNLQPLLKQGVTTSGTGTGPLGGAQLNPIGQAFQSFGQAGLQFNNTLGSNQYGPSNLTPRNPTNARFQGSANASLAFLQSPEDLGKLNKAIDSFVSAVESGAKGVAGSSQQLASALAANVGSLGDLQKALGAAGDNTPQSQLIQGQIAQLGQQRQAAAPFQTTPQAIAGNLAADAQVLKAGPGQSQASQANYAQAKQDYAQQIGALADFEKQRIMLNNQYQTQVYRTTQSYQLQVARADQDFYVQETYAAQDFNRQRTYAYQDYYKQVARQERDFGIQLTRETEDYQHQISLSTRDFNIQLGRQITDQAQALYDPYKRIQTQAVWDGKQLVANLAEQNAAVGKQKSQLDQVRGFGLSNQAIQQLNLNDPANAQQLAKLVNDFTSDPKLVAQINAQAATRISLGSALLNDVSNKDIQRAKDDFSRQLSDMQYDYTKQISRAKADFQKTLSDENVDFGTQLQRNQADYDITTTRSAQQFNTQMGRLNQDFGIQLAQMQQDLNTAEREIVISTGDLFTNLNKLTQGKINDVNKTETTGLADTLKIIQDPKNQSAINKAYKNLFPYDLSKIFGGPNPGVGAPSGGPDAAHMPGASGGPYAPYANAAAQQGMFAGRELGGMGTLFSPAAAANGYVSQGYGAHSAGAPNTGGGWPVADSTVTQLYHDPKTGGGHPGIDLAVPRGTPIYAPLPGIVVYAGWNDGYGNCVIMDNGGGRSTLYGHQQTIAARVGQKMKAGELIGYVDSTGNSTGDHLHFETRVNGMTQNPAVDLPIWQATAGLGSFDPGSVAASYGVTAPQFEKLKKSDYFGKNKGPWGALIEGALAMQALGTQATEANSAGTLSFNGSFPGVPTSGPLQDYAKKLLAAKNWTSQWDAFNYVENREAGWNIHATNPQSGAYGLAQALPPEKYASAGADWRTDGYTQLRWMIDYIAQRYGDPNAAAEHERTMNWYGTGGIFAANKRRVIGIGDAGVNEAAVPLNAAGIRVMATAMSQAMGAEELRSILTPGSADRITYVSQYTVQDHSVNIDVATMEVAADDPVSLGRQLEARARARNLTSTPRGVTP